MNLSTFRAAFNWSSDDIFKSIGKSSNKPTGDELYNGLVISTLAMSVNACVTYENMRALAIADHRHAIAVIVVDRRWTPKLLNKCLSHLGGQRQRSRNAEKKEENYCKLWRVMDYHDLKRSSSVHKRLSGASIRPYERSGSIHRRDETYAICLWRLSAGHRLRRCTCRVFTV